MDLLSGLFITLHIVIIVVENNDNDDFKSVFKAWVCTCVFMRCKVGTLPAWLDIWGKVWLVCLVYPRQHCCFQVCRVDLWV